MSNPGLMRRIPQPPTSVLVCIKVVLCILPIAQISIGSVHLNDCPRQHYIPIYLIVVGVFGLILALLACLPGSQPKDDNSSTFNLICRTWNSLVSFFLLCWFIAGNVWIYTIYQPNFNKNTTHVDQYCDKTLYQFAFWTTTLVYILLASFLFISCCIIVCFYLCGRADPDDAI
ncbi:transmembrane protein 272-like [Synchiropus splendidus]|uniref:transmembrane protein 272-like n=1 Tax=Synchiropus splendidus TaxID=270530 RepID=UPI00237E60B7|nr:transmembrane protein 272-like [Synchiropus splendidus]XP_053716429.1 transmembrane protein 272-like [Synchiropus splendidus]